MPMVTRWEPFKGPLDRWKELEEMEKHLPKSEKAKPKSIEVTVS